MFPNSLENISGKIGGGGIGTWWVMLCKSISKFQAVINNSTSHCNVAEGPKN